MEREYTTTIPPPSPLPDMTDATTSRRHYIGVRATGRVRARRRWIAEIREPYNRSHFWMGPFASPIAAARAYDTAQFYLRGRSVRFNFPEEIEAELTRELGLSVEQIMRRAHRVGARVDAMHAAGIDTLSSYEELVALEERIGNVSTGLSEEVIAKSLKQHKYTSMEEEEQCCICQEEYVEGDELGRLDCAHHFHSSCIKQWLTHKNLCPICKNTDLIT